MKIIRSNYVFLAVLIPFMCNVSAKANYKSLITNVNNRTTISLDGKWDIIIDPYENGYYNHKYERRSNGFFANRKPENISDLVEYDFDASEKLSVPGDWNTQSEKLLFYEGTIWYKKSFDYKKQADKRVFLYFGAVNYTCRVFLNGAFIGEHEGGFTPFNFEITDKINNGSNFVILMVNNTRQPDRVPTINTDWWNYGGITRSVKLIETPTTFINDYFIQLEEGSYKTITGWIQLNGNAAKEEVTLRIEELGIDQKISIDENRKAIMGVKADPVLWSPGNPKLYDIEIISGSDRIKDAIGFRKIETDGTNILLNGEKVYLRGISIHEEAPYRTGRASNEKDAETLLGWAKELGCNFVRLAHYPHNEHMLRLADEMGLMVWSEVPVYWTIQWENESVKSNAINQLSEMISRDKNRAAVIIWSMANETPSNDNRLSFLQAMIGHTKAMDSTRLVSAALLTKRLSEDRNTIIIDDPLGKYLDVIGINQYIGWYSGLPDRCDSTQYIVHYEKPVVISEFGAGALHGLYGDKLQRWTEDYQAYVYEENIALFERQEFITGMSPWILMDFRSPRRTLPGIQDGWNRKGLISEQGKKKKAFFVLQKYYNNKK